MFDFHTHSGFSSDAEGDPRNILPMARQAGLRAVSITDHNTTLQNDYIASEVEIPDGLTWVPGIELGAEIKGFPGFEVHSVLLFGSIEAAPGQDPALQTFIEVANNVIFENIRRIMKWYRDEEGIDVDEERLLEWTNDETPLRKQSPFKGPLGHVLRRYLKAKGLADDPLALEVRVKERHAGALLPSPVFPEALMKMIADSDEMLWILAHPISYPLEMKDKERMVGYLVDHGLDGIEALYKDADPEPFLDMAKRFGLLVSSGTDTHHWDAGKYEGNPATEGLDDALHAILDRLAL